MRLLLPVAVVLVLAGSAEAASCTYLEAEMRPTNSGAGGPLPAAGQTDWYRNGEPIELFGDRYEKFGLPREMTEFEFGGMVEAGKWKGVPAFTEESGEGEIIYVPVDPRICSFQPYEAKK